MKSDDILLSNYIQTLGVCQKRVDLFHVSLQYFVKLGFSKIAICIPDTAVNNQLVVRLSHGLPEASNKILKGGALGRVAAFEAFESNQVISLEAYSKQTRFVRTDLEVLAEIETALYLPLYHQASDCLHGLIIAATQAAPLTERQLVTAKDMSNALAEHLQRLPVKLEHSSETLFKGHTNASLKELNQAFQACIDTQDIYELSDVTMDYCLKLTGSEFGFVGYIDPETGFLTATTLTKEIFPSSNIPGKTLVFEKPGGLGGLVLDTNQIVVANDPMNHPASVGTPPGHLPIRRFLGLPCLLDGEKVGMIALANKLTDYTEADVELVKSFGLVYATKIASVFALQKLEQTNEKYISLYNDSPVAYFSMTADGNMIEANLTAKTLFSMETLSGVNLTSFLSEAESQKLNHWMAAKPIDTTPQELVLQLGEQELPVLLSMTLHMDERGFVEHYHCSLLDISARKRAEAQLNYLAYHDEITKIPNRAAMRGYLSSALEHAQRSGNKVGVLFFDIDRFKKINDTLGHSVGDELLKAVASRLKKHCRKMDFLARFGGDEFVLIVDSVRQISELTKVAQKLLQLLETPFLIGERSLYLTCCIGISVYPDDAVLLDDLVKNADVAMYKGKERGGANFTFYQQQFNISAHERLLLEAEMYRALEQGEFVLYYQPQYGVQTGKIIGVEALVRWIHPEKGLIPPDQFISLAEENGLILPLGEKIMDMALAQLTRWQSMGCHDLKMSINISAKQFYYSQNLYDTLTALLVKYRINPSTVWVEITESALMNAEEALNALNKMKNLGVKIAIDDFGTGYSSLSYLRKLPISILKIDKSFIDDIGKSPDDEAISRAVISMAHSMGMQVVAEGVESEAHLDFLQVNGCDYYQGYYSSRPLAADICSELLKSSAL